MDEDTQRIFDLVQNIRDRLYIDAIDTKQALVELMDAMLADLSKDGEE